jgi:DoxX-like family
VPVAYTVIVIVLALLALAAAAAQLARVKAILDSLIHVGLSERIIPLLAACLIAGGLGLLIGLWYPLLGLAAAVGLVLFFVAATIAHLRKSDFKGLPAPLTMLILAVSAVSLQVLNA